VHEWNAGNGFTTKEEAMDIHCTSVKERKDGEMPALIFHIPRL
jgi:hypothetical protein